MMLKFFILSAVVLHLFHCVCSGDYTFDPLPKFKIVRLDKNSSPKKLKLTGYACPVETLKDYNIIRSIAKVHKLPKLKYCIFNKPFTDENNSRCEAPVPPIFLPNKNEQELVNCGWSNTHILHFFGFYCCGNEEDYIELRGKTVRKARMMTKAMHEYRKMAIRQSLSKFGEKIKTVIVYEVCYDTAINETVWTKNKIVMPLAFDKMNVKNEKSVTMEFSTDPFLLEKPHFKRIKKIYQTQNQTQNSEPEMIPQPLTPPEHFAYDVWKSTTLHIINTFPLWKQLKSLMTAINIGLKKAQMTLYSSNPNSRLEFYTRVTRIHLATPGDRLSSENFLQPNIWYKLVYEKITMTGLLIYIHNTPHHPPLVKNCNEPVTCEFKRWTNNNQLKETITESELKYAYCCKVTTEQVGEIFFDEIKIESELALNDLIVRSFKRKGRDFTNFEPFAKTKRISEVSTSAAEPMKIDSSTNENNDMEFTQP